MTSFAFILGVVPLIVSRGAGAEMRQTLGMAVFSGMLGVTLFGLLLTPVFFYSIDWLGERHIFASSFMQHVNRASLAVSARHRSAGRHEPPGIGRRAADGRSLPLARNGRSNRPSSIQPPVNGKTPHLQPHVMRKQLEAANAPAAGLSREELTNEE